MFGDNFEWDNTAALADEGMSIQEKRKTVKLALPFAFISIIASAALIYLTTLIKAEYEDISHFFYNIVLTIAISGISISFLVLLWVGSHKLIKDGDEILDNHNPIDTVLFLLTFVQILVNISIILYIFLENRIIKDYYLAEHGQTNFDVFQEKYGYLVNYGVLAIFVQELCFIMFAYCLYMTSLTYYDGKVLIHGFNWIFVLSALMTMWCIVNASNMFDSVTSLKNYAGDLTLKILYYFSCLALTISLFVLYINTKKSKVNYLYLGTLLLLFSIISTGVNRQILLTARTIEKSYIEDCNSENLLQSASAQYLSKQRCEKYQKKIVTNVTTGKPLTDKDGNPKKTYSLDCPSDFSAQIWEESNKVSQSGCLNMGCCQVLADSYAIWWYRTGFISFGMITTGFFIAMVSFFLSQREKLSQSYVNLFGVHFTAGIILIGIIAYGFYFVQFGYTYQLKQIEKQTVKSSGKSKNNNNLLINQFMIQGQESYVQNYSQSKYLDCEKFSSFLIEPVNIQQVLDNNEQQEVQVSIMPSYGNFKFDQKYLNDENLKVFSTKYKNQYLLKNEKQNEDQYIQVQGKLNYINEFLNQKLHFCGANPLQEPLFLIDTKMVNSQNQNEQMVQHNDYLLKQEHFNQQTKCDLQLEDIINKYNENCLKIGQGNFSQQKGDFQTVWGYGQISQSFQKIQGSIITEEYDCQQQQNQGSQQNSVSVQGATVELYFDNQLFKTVESDKNGEFMIQIPTFYNNVQFLGEIRVNYHKTEGFLELKLSHLLGAKYDINLGELNLVTMTGKSQPLIDNQCINNQKQQQQIQKKSHKNKNGIKSHNSFKNDDKNIEENLQFQQNKNNEIQELQICQNRVQQIQNSLKTCSIQFNTNQNVIQENNSQKLNNLDLNNKNKHDSLSNPQNQKKILETQFYDLNFQIYDIKDKSDLKNQIMTINLYKNYHSCQQKPDDKDIYKSLQISSNTVTFYNILSNYYTINVVVNGYYSYCANIQVNENKQEMLIPLVKKGNEEYQVVLEHNNHSLSSSLSVQTYNINNQEQEQCLVNQQNQSCDNIQLYSSEISGRLGQLITIDQLKDQSYLFFLQKIPVSQQEQLINENIASGVQIPLNILEKDIDNSEFWQGNLKIKVYVPQREFQALETQIPQTGNNKNIEFDPILSWLSVCVNGNYGNSSTAPLDHFWTRNSENSYFFNQNVEADIMYPNSDICQSFYKYVDIQ